MGIFNRSSLYASHKKMTVPVYKTPEKIRQALDVYRIFQDGIFQIEPDSKGSKLFDKAFAFPDINYKDKDDEEKDGILLTLCKVFNTMSLDYKFVAANEKRDMDIFHQEILQEPERSVYPELAKANNELVLNALKKGNPHIKKQMYFVMTCRKKTYEEAKEYFNILYGTLAPIFEALRSELIELDAIERLRSLHDFFRLNTDDKFELQWEDIVQNKRAWKNDVLPYLLETNNNKSIIKMHDQCVQLLYAAKLPNTLDEGKVMSSFTNMPFHTVTTLDIACVPRDVLKGKLQSANINNEVAINQEQELNNRNGHFTSGPSFIKRKRREELEDYMEQVDENDENGFFLGVLIAVRGETEEQLKANVEKVKLKAAGLSITLQPYYDQQLQALNTVLPIGARRVNQMRAMLTSSLVAFQPFHARDVIHSGGNFFGINKRTNNIIMINRKKLKNTNCVIIGHTGSGKSFLLKETEFGQTLLSTDEDIFAIDPQNETEGVTKYFGGQFFDLGAQSGVYLNPFEVPQEVMYSTDIIAQRVFIARKAEYAEALCFSLLMNILPNGFHKSIVNRCVNQMYKEVFLSSKPTSPTLVDFSNLLKQQTEPEARDLYGALEVYVEGTFDMLSKQSTLDITNRLNVFGMKNVPDTMWEAIMLTILHLLELRIDYNVKLQKATHFVVDEGQYISKKPASAQILNKAFLTFRKYGGINTLLLQNASAALANANIKDLVANSDLKIFFDQGGNDRNELATILELSNAEFKELANPKPGHCVIVCGDDILRCNARISKESPLYNVYSTNFHEKAEEGANVFFEAESEHADPLDDSKKETDSLEILEIQEEAVIMDGVPSDDEGQSGKNGNFIAGKDEQQEDMKNDDMKKSNSKAEEENASAYCPNCGTIITGKFCRICGQPLPCKDEKDSDTVSEDALRASYPVPDELEPEQPSEEVLPEGGSSVQEEPAEQEEEREQKNVVLEEPGDDKKEEVLSELYSMLDTIADEEQQETEESLLSEKESNVLELFEREPLLSQDDVEILLSISKTSAAKLLEQLLEKQKLVKRGNIYTRVA